MIAKELFLELQSLFQEGQIDDMYLELQRETQSAYIGSDYEFDEQWKSRESRISAIKRLPESPYPGLRPFRTSEAPLFFGREKLENEIIDLLSKRRLIAVTGSSGTGKSSLIRAGLIPKLHWGRLITDHDKWRVSICRPGLNPIENLAISLTCSRFFSNITAKASIEKGPKELYEHVSKTLHSSNWGLMELEEEITKDSHNSLIIIDQFEEIFRFQEEMEGTDKEHEATTFVQSLINATSEAFNNHIYVILTMRSEFLGDCVKFKNLTEIINNGQYLIPKLSPIQIQAAIEKPARVVNTQVSPLLIKKLVDAIRGNQDQLPVLQHLLMRCYQQWQNNENKEVIDINDYEAAGGIDASLNIHADSIYESLDERGRKAIEIILRTITDPTGIRRPRKFKEIVSIAAFSGINERDLRQALLRFGSNDCSFTYPSSDSAIKSDTMIDISHESLMRLWERLKVWMKDEQHKGEQYDYIQGDRLYTEQQKQEGNNEENWMEGKRAILLNEWWKNENAGLVWAKRYHRQPEFKREIEREKALRHVEKITEQIETNAHLKIYSKNKHFLQMSLERHQSVLEAEESAAKRKENITQIAIIVAVAVISVFLSLYAQNSKLATNRDQLEAERAKLKKANEEYEILDKRQKQTILKNDSLVLVLQTRNENLDSIRTRLSTELKNSSQREVSLIAATKDAQNQRFRAEELAEQAQKDANDMAELLKRSEALEQEKALRNFETIRIIDMVKEGISEEDPNDGLQLLLEADQLVKNNSNLEINPFMAFGPLELLYEEETFYQQIAKIDSCDYATFSEDATYLAVGKQAKEFNNDYPTLIFRMDRFQLPIDTLHNIQNPQFTRNNRLYYYQEEKVKSWSLSNIDQEITNFENPKTVLEDVGSFFDITGSGRFILAGNQNGVDLYDINGKILNSASRASLFDKPPKKKIIAIADGPTDGNFLIRFGDNALMAINQVKENDFIDNLQKKKTYDLADTWISIRKNHLIDFSPQGQYLMINDPKYRTTNIYRLSGDLQDIKAVGGAFESGNYIAFNSNVKSYAFSRDERYVAVTFEQGVDAIAPEIWDLKDRKLEYQLKGKYINNEENILGMCFSEDVDNLTTLITISDAGRILQWMIEKPDLSSYPDLSNLRNKIDLD